MHYERIVFRLCLSGISILLRSEDDNQTEVLLTLGASSLQNVRNAGGSIGRPCGSRRSARGRIRQLYVSVRTVKIRL